MIRGRFAALFAVAIGLGAGAAHAQTLAQHLDCAATMLLHGTIYPEHRPETERRLSVIYDAIRNDHTIFATVSDKEFQVSSVEGMEMVIQETLAKGGEDGALAFLIRFQECEMAYGFDWLGLLEDSR